MQQKDLPAKAGALEALCAQFRAWRQSREKRSPIPEQLWKAAVQLSSQYGVNKVAKALRLNYYGLKKRLHSHTATLQPEEASHPVFVELDVRPPGRCSECVIEIENSRGVKMKMFLKGQGCVDVVALLRSLWSQ